MKEEIKKHIRKPLTNVKFNNLLEVPNMPDIQKDDDMKNECKWSDRYNCKYCPHADDCDVVKNEVPSNARGLEYRVVKDFDGYKLALNDDFHPGLLKSFLRLGKVAYETGAIIPGDGCVAGDHAIGKELLRLGYTEKVVVDPVVKVGDTFRDSEGQYYSISYSDTNSDKVMLRNIISGIKWDIDYIVDWHEDMHLSEFMYRGDLALFTPCKIEIREVEE